jgi:hypothetical protein
MAAVSICIAKPAHAFGVARLIQGSRNRCVEAARGDGSSGCSSRSKPAKSDTCGYHQPEIRQHFLLHRLPEAGRLWSMLLLAC